MYRAHVCGCVCGCELAGRTQRDGDVSRGKTSSICKGSGCVCAESHIHHRENFIEAAAGSPRKGWGEMDLCSIMG